MKRHPLSVSMIALGVASLVTAGCIHRTLMIDSEPQGAIVYLNDEEVGRTPVSVPFTFYGVYDVRLEKEDYATLVRHEALKGPWWETPGPDLFVEALPWTTRVDVLWRYTLTPAEPTDEGRLLERANELRQQVN